MTMRRKGFTLVELLAVIAIVAILMLAAGAGIISTMNNSKVNVFKNEAVEVANAAQKLYNELSMSGRRGTSFLVQDSERKYQAMCVTLAGLINNGYIEKDISNYGGVILVEAAVDGTETKEIIWMHNSTYGINGIEKKLINKLSFKDENNGGKNGITSADEISGGKVGVVTTLSGIYKMLNYAQTANEELASSRVAGLKPTETAYGCQRGALQGDICVIEDTTPPNSVTYSCRDGFDLYDTTCTKTETAEKSCPSGYTTEESNCYKYQVSNKICPSGYSRYEDRCRKMTGSAALSCPSGYSLSGSTCRKTITTDPSCPSGYTTYTTTQCKKTLTAPPTCPSGYIRQGIRCRKITDSSYIHASCPSGYHFYGSVCERTDYKPKTCPSGYSMSGARCTRTETATPTCPGGYTNTGVSCVAYSYESLRCPEGYSTYNGDQCRVLISSGTISSIGVCPSGFTSNGSNCIKTTTVDATPNVTCPSGFTQRGLECVKTSTVPATTFTNETSLQNGSRDDSVTGYSIKRIYSYSNKSGTKSATDGTVSEKDRGGTGSYYERIPCINNKI